MTDRLYQMRMAVAAHHNYDLAYTHDANWQMLGRYMARACTAIKPNGTIFLTMPDGCAIVSDANGARIILAP